MVSTFKGQSYWVVRDAQLVSVNAAGGGTGGGGGPEEPLDVQKRQGTARPFAEDSPWNTPLTGSETWYDSVRLRTYMVEEGLPGPIRHWYVAMSSVSVNYADNNDPVWTADMPNYVYTPFNRNRTASEFTVHAPDDIVEDQDSDHILILQNTDTGHLLDVWQAETTNSPYDPDDGGWTPTGLPPRTISNRPGSPGWAVSNVITDPGAGSTISPPTGLGTNDGTRAANFSWLAGLLTQRDMDSVEIDHALVVSLGYVTFDNTNWIAPATATDNGGHDGPLRMGDRIGLPPDTVEPDWDPAVATIGHKIYECLKTHGAYVGDFVGSPYPMLYIDAKMSAPSQAEVGKIFVWWESYTPVMDELVPFLRIANRNPGG